MSVFEILMQKDAGRGPSTYEYFGGPVVQRFSDEGSGIFIMLCFRGEIWSEFPCRKESKPPPWIGRVAGAQKYPLFPSNGRGWEQAATNRCLG